MCIDNYIHVIRTRIVGDFIHHACTYMYVCVYRLYNDSAIMCIRGYDACMYEHTPYNLLMGVPSCEALK